jgi:4-hydroxy-tetrahydrodipicolinate reductase
VAVDFTFHTAVPGNAAAAAAAGTALVIGTTGLDEAETAAVGKAAGKIAIVHAPNMSLGVNLLFALAGRAAEALGLEYDVEIVETHHRHKKDAPSGTALKLGECVALGRGQKLAQVVVHGREGQTGERPRGQIGMHAVRAGAVVGDHTVLFASEGERVELTHRAISRDTFAMGALRAAQWAVGRPAGLYDMKSVLEL